mmetsp:Transcript_10246/g.28110  ORF Transcript_10246/g.28110 Transcript_10246/m.28110 type:complete len:207 (+) Transcript_10246:1199-1819(+)
MYHNHAIALASMMVYWPIILINMYLYAHIMSYDTINAPRTGIIRTDSLLEFCLHHDFHLLLRFGLDDLLQQPHQLRTRFLQLFHLALRQLDGSLQPHALEFLVGSLLLLLLFRLLVCLFAFLHTLAFAIFLFLIPTLQEFGAQRSLAIFPFLGALLLMVVQQMLLELLVLALRQLPMVVPRFLQHALLRCQRCVQSILRLLGFAMQ